MHSSRAQCRKDHANTCILFHLFIARCRVAPTALVGTASIDAVVLKTPLLQPHRTAPVSGSRPYRRTDGSGVNQSHLQLTELLTVHPVTTPCSSQLAPHSTARLRVLLLSLVLLIIHFWTNFYTSVSLDSEEA